jgi:uncharacterized Zn ribbon protein
LKNKTKTYLLLVAVLVIWSIIGYKIYSSLNPELPEVVLNDAEAVFNPKTGIEIDTFSIKTTDRDPFLGTLTKKSNKTASLKQNNTTKQEDSNWPQITYGGVIKRQNSNEQVFVVTINNTQYVLKKGQKVDNITLVKGDNASITVRFNNTQKIIPIQK